MPHGTRTAPTTASEIAAAPTVDEHLPMLSDEAHKKAAREEKREEEEEDATIAELEEVMSRVLEFIEDKDVRESGAYSALLFDHLSRSSPVETDTENPTSKSGKGHTMAGDESLSLASTYNDADLHALIDHLASGSRLHARHVLDILDNAKNILACMPNVRELHVRRDRDQFAVVVGDLAGSWRDLVHLIDKYGVPGLRHKFVFSGGISGQVLIEPQQQQTDGEQARDMRFECLLVVLYAFVMRPYGVYVLRGRYDDAALTHSCYTLQQSGSSLLSDLIERLYEHSQARLIQSGVVDAMAYLPLATRLIMLDTTHNDHCDDRGDDPNNSSDDDTLDDAPFQNARTVLVVHGGIGGDANGKLIDMDYICSSRLQRHLHRSLFDKSTTATATPTTMCDLNELRALLWSKPLDAVDRISSFCLEHSFTHIICSSSHTGGVLNPLLNCQCVALSSASCQHASNKSGAVLEFHPVELEPRVYTYRTATRPSVEQVSRTCRFLLDWTQSVLSERVDNCVDGRRHHMVAKDVSILRRHATGHDEPIACEQRPVIGRLVRYALQLLVVGNKDRRYVGADEARRTLLELKERASSWLTSAHVKQIDDAVRRLDDDHGVDEKQNVLKLWRIPREDYQNEEEGEKESEEEEDEKRTERKEETEATKSMRRQLTPPPQPPPQLVVVVSTEKSNRTSGGGGVDNMSDDFFDSDDSEEGDVEFLKI